MPAPDLDRIFDPTTDFHSLTREIWNFQLHENEVLAKFVNKLANPQTPVFFPIELFKSHRVVSGTLDPPDLIFRSSGTGGDARSTHFVKDAGLYRRSALEGWKYHYGKGKWTILALLPHYLEQGESSLVWMVREFIEAFGNPGSGFFLNEKEELFARLVAATDRGERILLWGVAYALLDFGQKFGFSLPQDAIVMETGGMKGRAKELTREELHFELNKAFGVPIHSEYGMTEMLSQAYSFGNGRFYCPPWMNLRIGDPVIPFRWLEEGEVGRIHVMDLANVYSCSFIRTEDLGRQHPDGSFEVLGRLDHSEVRGCNLLSP